MLMKDYEKALLIAFKEGLDHSDLVMNLKTAKLENFAIQRGFESDEAAEIVRDILKNDVQLSSGIQITDYQSRIPAEEDMMPGEYWITQPKKKKNQERPEGRNFIINGEVKYLLKDEIKEIFDV